MTFKYKLKRIIQLILLLVGYFLIFIVAKDISELCILLIAYMFLCIEFFITVFKEIKKCMEETK